MAGGGIISTEKNGWRLQWKDDGTDYPALLEEFISGRLTGRSLSTGSSFREVWRVEAGGRVFVIKRDWEIDRRLEKRLWEKLGGTPYQRLIRLTNRAVGRGCPVVQDVYLVAENISGGRWSEAWLIAEFVEGDSLILEFQDGAPARFLDIAQWIGPMSETIAELHDYGLASNDLHPGQFVISQTGLKVIDLSLDSPILVCQVNDALTFRHFFKVVPPMRSWRRRALFRLMSLGRRFKNFKRKILKRKK